MGDREGETLAALAALFGAADAEVPSWWDQAVCAQTDPEIFYPEQGVTAKVAKAVCLSCPVRAACLDWAIETGQQWGVWGGVAERDRRRMIRQRQAGTPNAQASATA